MTTHVLILCSHNSARSVLAEGMLRHLAAKARADVQAHSAGSTPSGRINPLALEVLASAGVSTSGLRSKSWDEFTGPAAPLLRVVITVCDSAAQEACPYWAGAPVQVHWGYPDPSNTAGGAEAKRGSDHEANHEAEQECKRAAFDLTRQAIAWRLQQLLALPLATLSDAELKAALVAIGKS